MLFLILLLSANFIQVLGQVTCGVSPIPPIEEFDNLEYNKGKDGVSRVVGGRETIPNSWPWQISLRRGFLASHTCGGSVLTPNWILTAAHCVSGGFPSDFYVDAGRHNLNSAGGTVQRVAVQRIIVHPFWNSATIDSDIALLRLAQPLQYNNFVRPVCLPSRDAIDNERCVLTGWGETQGTGGVGLLKQAPMPIVNQQTCASSGWMGPMVSSNMVCAGWADGMHGGCSGDSGGPLQCKIGSQWAVKGAVSWGRIPCSLPFSPTVFARVFVFNNWINNNINADP